MLHFLYETAVGRCILKFLTRPAISRIAGNFCDSRASRFLIPWFARKNHIRLEEFEDIKYESFNQFFCRKIRKGYRVIDRDPEAFIAPCDGLLSIYPIKDGLVVPVKRSRYRIADLLRDPVLAAEYEGGTCLVFRLCVNHYHRYIYLDQGTKSKNVFLPGVLHTVRPIALRNRPVFVENAREYTVLHTGNHGDVVQMEVGAMLVGRIRNLHQKAEIQRGQEKGYFEYGGSTIILLVKPGEVEFPLKWYKQTERGQEIPVKMGERLNRSKIKKHGDRK
ncbi:MAG: phosphatidylserine decarboxylase [Eubacteriales bacterium]|nr:phosphatidylserine decarboxylase [Eubacteriales bacterium]